MMVSVETVLLRGKRQADKWLAKPWIQRIGKCALFTGGGAILSGAALWNAMQPIALGLILGTGGWWSVFAALGSGLGYRLFWGMAGLEGVVWALGGLGLALVLPFFEKTGKTRWRRAAGAVVLVSLSSLFVRFRLGTSPPSLLVAGRMGIAAVCALLSHRVIHGRDRLSTWILCSFGVLALSGLGAPKWADPGAAAVGFLCAVAPLPASVLAGVGADAAGSVVSMAGIAGLSWFFQLLPIRESWRRMLSPPLAALGIMVLQGKFSAVLLPLALGSAAGALIPWQLHSVPRKEKVGAVQVQLEKIALVLGGFQRQLLEYAPPPLDVDGITEQLKLDACGTCPNRGSCKEQARLSEDYLDGSEEFLCRKSGRMAVYLHQSRDRLKRMKAARNVQEEYRCAVSQQYGFLAELLHTTADRLPERVWRGQAKFRVQVSSRSKSKGYADGDRVLAFPGVGCRFYVMLCDGMGTGMGAMEEGQQAGSLLKQMLTAGISPDHALGGLNSQLTLLGRGGAVAVDLAELRLDSGSVTFYKWGASPSWILGKHHARQVGTPTLPPGLSVRAPGQHGRVRMERGEVLVMLSDGVAQERAALWAEDIQGDPGILAERILADSGTAEDDATAVVVRLMEIPA